MEKIAITLRQDIADWLRIEAAKADASMSGFVADNPGDAYGTRQATTGGA
jgi:hypothetical protein